MSIKNNKISYNMAILFLHKNFAAHIGVCHIGLGVAALNTSLTLNDHGFNAQVVGIVKYQDIDTIVQQYKPNVVVISAPWIPPHYFKYVVAKHPLVHFVSICHSNVGFLFADTNGIKNLRSYFEIQKAYPNFHIAGNSEKFKIWLSRAYDVPCLWLPNLYHLPKKFNKIVKNKNSVLKLGCYGAVRPLKNIMTSAGVALEISSRLKRPVEFWVSGGRTETGAWGVKQAIAALLEGTSVTIKENFWQPWEEFRKTVASMDLLLQLSYTESFNMVTADGIAEGVPSVVSEAIDWCPKQWIANCDDCDEIASVAISLLRNPGSIKLGRKMLRKYISRGTREWERFLNNLR
jgi:hypothetical protein